MKWFDFLKSLTQVFPFLEKWLDWKTLLADEKEQVRKVANEIKETNKKRKLIKSYEKLLDYEAKKNMKVVDSEDGELVVLITEVADSLPEVEKLRFLKRRRLKKNK